MTGAGNGRRPGGLPEEFQQEVRKQATQQAAKWTIGAIGLLALFAASGWWFYLKPKLIETFGGLPANAVVAFDSPGGCPDGWKIFDAAISRTIVGSTQGQSASPNHDEHGVLLSARPYRRDGGEEAHVLTTEEIPAHNHGIVDFLHNDFQRGQGGYVGTEKMGRDSAPVDPNTPIRYSDPTGGGKPHNIMSPYISLFYCVKQ
jgi:hypothetical protein